MSQKSVAYPIIFTINDVVATSSALIDVRACGRALMAEEDGAWWLFGVEPGGIADSGASPQEAFLRFTETFKKALCEIAEDAGNFERFEVAARAFFTEADGVEADRWRTAVATLRAGAQVPAPFSTLPIQPAEQPLFISLTPHPPAAFGAQRSEMAAMASAA
jgi:hypothetical protein